MFPKNKRTNIKALVEKYGADYVIKNISRLLFFKIEAYSPKYIYQLKYKIKYRYGKKSIKKRK